MGAFLRGKYFHTENMLTRLWNVKTPFLLSVQWPRYPNEDLILTNRFNDLYYFCGTWEVAMAGKFDTPLANLYQEMVERGQVAPVAEPGRFRYPSALKVVPSFTTYGATTLSAEGTALAELEPSSK